jgi:hypothetical protein
LKIISTSSWTCQLGTWPTSWLTPLLTKNHFRPEAVKFDKPARYVSYKLVLELRMCRGTGLYPYSVRCHFDPMTTYVSQDHKYTPSPVANFLVPILVLRVTESLSIVDRCTFCLLVDACSSRPGYIAFFLFSRRI